MVQWKCIVMRFVNKFILNWPMFGWCVCVCVWKANRVYLYSGPVYSTIFVRKFHVTITFSSIPEALGPFLPLKCFCCEKNNNENWLYCIAHNKKYLFYLNNTYVFFRYLMMTRNMAALNTNKPTMISDGITIAKSVSSSAIFDYLTVSRWFVQTAIDLIEKIWI